MTILLRYISRLFAARFALILAGFVSLVLLLDIMANSGDIIADAAGVGGLWRYGWLRLPLITSRLIPFSTLIAALLTLINLVRHHELVVMSGAGMSQLKLITAFLPVGLAIAGLHFWLDDRASPAAIAALNDWGVAGYAGPASGGDGEILWVREGNDVIRLRRSEAAHSKLGSLTIFRRDRRGNLIERLDAAAAANNYGAWTLYDVTRREVADNRVTTMAEMAWNGKLRPSQISTLSSHPKTLSFSAVKRFVNAPGYGSRPLYVYKTWLMHKLAAPLASIIMILLAVPLTQRFQRYGGLGATLATGIGLGFCYFVFEGFTLAVGEAGLLPPLIAAWSPSVAFAAVAGAIGFYGERR